MKLKHQYCDKQNSNTAIQKIQGPFSLFRYYVWNCSRLCFCFVGRFKSFSSMIKRGSSCTSKDLILNSRQNYMSTRGGECSRLSSVTFQFQLKKFWNPIRMLKCWSLYPEYIWTCVETFYIISKLDWTFMLFWEENIGERESGVWGRGESPFWSNISFLLASLFYIKESDISHQGRYYANSV